MSSCRYKTLQSTLRTIIRLLPAVANFAVLMILFVYIASLMGMQMFAYRFHFNPDGVMIQIGSPGFAAASVPRQNFDNLWSALLTTFQAITGEDWDRMMYAARRTDGIPGAFFFIFVVIFGNWVVLSLFLAMLVRQFELLAEEEDLQSFKVHEVSVKAVARALTDIVREAAACSLLVLAY